MYRNGEVQKAFGIHTQQLLCYHQVSGTGNGKEFGQTLDNAQ